ncbi:MAG: nitroreductase family protein, partial [Acidimicrobiaceae bacterium]|nr:nitroreductase family protein [Acidimicrobiaceae bacterium]
MPEPALRRILDSATKGPSAGFTQGFDFLVLDHQSTLDVFWELAITRDWKARATSHDGLWDAPIVIIPLANADAYAERYAKADKSYANLNELSQWPVPYWYIDTAFATMLILNSVVNENLGALFFGLFRNVDLIKQSFGIPNNFQPIGAIAIGYPTSNEVSSSSR